MAQPFTPCPSAGRDGALVRVIVPIGGDETKAEALGVKFVKELFPVLGQYLPA